jgi:phosphoglycolate phosphatase
MDLQALASYGDIAIQCHDVPDADAIASGFALMKYLESRGGSARLIYGGRNRVGKPNLKLMLKLLDIPLEHVEELSPPDLLITVDSQYGAGNVTRFAAREIAVFDHHYPEIQETPRVVIRPALGSCATLVWDLMRCDGFDFSAHADVFTALFYGLFTDTHYLAEMRHPLDRDLAEFLPVDQSVIKRLKYSELSLDELGIVSHALSSPRFVGDIGLLRARPCDPNILGFSSDVARQVDQFACCIVYCHLPAGLKLSIRSTVREIMANELAAFLTRGTGSGGGNEEKAGAYLNFSGIEKAAPGTSPDDYLLKRVREYQENYDLVYHDHHRIDFASAARFKKLRTPRGFARTTDVFPEGARIRVRTLEGDIDLVASQEVYVMVGVAGEVYPIRRERFERDYERVAGGYRTDAEYPPSVIEKTTGEKKSILPFTQLCLPREEKFIRALKLGKDAKVFSHWDREKYFLGRAGDYLAAPETDFSDVYVVNREIFARSYAKIGETGDSATE